MDCSLEKKCWKSCLIVSSHLNQGSVKSSHLWLEKCNQFLKIKSNDLVSTKSQAIHTHERKRPHSMRIIKKVSYILVWVLPVLFYFIFYYCILKKLSCQHGNDILSEHGLDKIDDERTRENPFLITPK